MANAPGLPRGPVPPLPEFADRLRYENFDEAYRNGMTNTEVVLNGYTFAESWSGYALRRSGAVVPFLLPAVDSDGRTNLSCHAGAIRFWFKPEWTSVSLPGGTGPGANALLAELAAAGGGQSVGIWSLEVNPDGSALSLVAQSDGGPVQLLSAQMSWQCGQWYLITLDYDPAGTALFFGDQWAAQSANPIVIPPTAGVLALGSTVTGVSPAGGEFEEFRSFERPLDPADLTRYYNPTSWHAALGPITQAEIDAREQAMAAALATRSFSTLASMRPEGPFEPLDALCDCMTGGQVYLTNLFATIRTNQSMAVKFNLAGGTNFVWYGVYSMTNLANEQWVWLTNTYTCTLVSLTNQPWPYVFYAVRSPSPTMVVAWGDSWYGACDVPPELTNAIDVAGGYDFSLALNADGTVAAWGDNTYGQTNVPAGLTNVTGIAAGGNFALALLQNDTVVAWGGNDAGQRNLPAGLTNVAAIAAGGAHAIVLRNGGTVVAWGFNLYGQTTVPTLGPVKQVAAGFDHSVALLTNGTVVVWGLQGSGFGWNITNVPVGLSNVVSIAAGGYHTLALKADGTVTAWGAGTTTEGYLNLGQSIVPGGLSNVVAVAGGVAYSMALQSDGTVVEWGDDTYDELELPDRLTGVRTISAGGYHSLAIRYGQLTPLITDEPDSQMVFPGGNATFLVQAVGVAALTYQWQLNGVNIPGATNAMLTLSNVQSEVAGAYQVIISSSSGSVTSDVATLTVPRPAYGPGLVSGWGANANGEMSWQTDTTNVISLAAGKAHGIVAQDNGLVVNWGSYWTGYNYGFFWNYPVIFYWQV